MQQTDKASRGAGALYLSPALAVPLDWHFVELYFAVKGPFARYFEADEAFAAAAHCAA